MPEDQMKKKKEQSTYMLYIGLHVDTEGVQSEMENRKVNAKDNEKT